MGSSRIKVVHYLNPFFAGLGAEEQADAQPLLLDGPAGSGKLLAQMLGAHADILATVVCGDNYASEHGETAADEVLKLLRPLAPDVAILGPGFDAGRYGAACAAIGHRIAAELAIPCVTALYRENPGVRIYRDFRNPRLYCLPTTRSAAGLRDVAPHLVSLALRLARGEMIGPADVEGYLPRGIRRRERAQQCGADRAMAMLIAKLNGHKFHTELPYSAQSEQAAAPPLAALAASKVAIITTAGVVPSGNPDRFFLRGNTFWRKYAIGELERLEIGAWSAVHGGYSTSWMNQNPNLGVPLDALRYWEQQGVFGKLAPWFYSIPGVGAEFDQASRMGREIAADLKAHEIDAALLVST